MQAIKSLGLSLLPVWEQALDLKPGFFKPSFTDPYCYLRMAKYPKVDFVQDNDRYSFVWFINTDLEAVAECLPSCRPESGPPKYEPQCY